MKRLLFKLVILMVVSAASLLLGEVVLRYAVELPRLKPLPQVRYAPDPVRRFHLLPDQEGYTGEARFRVDRNGFRSNGAAPPPAPERTWVALGDSFTFGMGVADRATWPAVLERRLNRRNPGSTRVINAGTISYGVFQEMDLLRRQVLPLQPDGVIHCLYWNDFMSARPPGPDDPAAVNDAGYFTWDDPRPPGGFLRRSLSRLSNRSALLFTLKRTVRRILGRDRGASDYEKAYGRFLAGDIDPEELQPIDRFYGEMAVLAEEHNFDLVVVILPVIDLAGRPGSGDHAFVRHVREILDRHRIRYVDGFRLWEGRFAGENSFLPYNRHLNEHGYELVAKELEKRLAE